MGKGASPRFGGAATTEWIAARLWRVVKGFPLWGNPATRNAFWLEMRQAESSSLAPLVAVRETIAPGVGMQLQQGENISLFRLVAATERIALDVGTRPEERIDQAASSCPGYFPRTYVLAEQ